MTADDDDAVPWRLMAAKATGSSHARTGLPCQDAFAVRALPGGALIAAIADGAGSAPEAAAGAALTVEAAMHALEHLAADLPVTDDALGQALRGVLREAFFALVTRADAAQTPVTHFHATLSCLLVSAEVALVAQIGDGAVTLVHADGRLELALPPQHGEYANSTFFVTQYPSLPAAGTTRIVRAPIIGGLLTTDGLIELAYTEVYRHCTPFAGFMAPLFRGLAAPGGAHLDAKLGAFLDRPLIRDKTSDDLSVIMALRAGVVLPPLYVTAPASAVTAGEPDLALPPPETDLATADSPAAGDSVTIPEPALPASGSPPVNSAAVAPPGFWNAVPIVSGEPRTAGPDENAAFGAAAGVSLTGGAPMAIAGHQETGEGASSAAQPDRLADPVLTAAPGPPDSGPGSARAALRRSRRRR